MSQWTLESDSSTGRLGAGDKQSARASRSNHAKFLELLDRPQSSKIRQEIERFLRDNRKPTPADELVAAVLGFQQTLHGIIAENKAWDVSTLARSAPQLCIALTKAITTTQPSYAQI